MTETKTPDENATKSYRLLDDERSLLATLRASRRQRRKRGTPYDGNYTVGQRVADRVAASMGSWPFILIQSAILAIWIVLNIVAFVHHWDPYPFILLNLALSFQAAYAAPFIMMSQNRQAAVDRTDAANDYKVNIKAELEIELLHQKIDELRDKEILLLTEAVRSLTAIIEKTVKTGPAESEITRGS
jgi:uncharacterized membrane protein